MAQRINIVVIDDIDGSEDAKTITFSLAGKNYEIDLGPQNTEKLHSALAPFIGHARRVERKPGKPRAGSRVDSAAVRAWAREQGIEVNDRGRIPADIVARYEAATG